MRTRRSPRSGGRRAPARAGGHPRRPGRRVAGRLHPRVLPGVGQPGRLGSGLREEPRPAVAAGHLLDRAAGPVAVRRPLRPGCAAGPARRRRGRGTLARPAVAQQPADRAGGGHGLPGAARILAAPGAGPAAAAGRTDGQVAADPAVDGLPPNLGAGGFPTSLSTDPASRPGIPFEPFPGWPTRSSPARSSSRTGDRGRPAARGRRPSRSSASPAAGTEGRELGTRDRPGGARHGDPGGRRRRGPAATRSPRADSPPGLAAATPRRPRRARLAHLRAGDQPGQPRRLDRSAAGLASGERSSRSSGSRTARRPPPPEAASRRRPIPRPERHEFGDEAHRFDAHICIERGDERGEADHPAAATPGEPGRRPDHRPQRREGSDARSRRVPGRAGQRRHRRRPSARPSPAASQPSPARARPPGDPRPRSPSLARSPAAGPGQTARSARDPRSRHRGPARRPRQPPLDRQTIDEIGTHEARRGRRPRRHPRARSSRP